MMKKQHIENAAKILKAMGNERRLEVLYNLYAVESNVGELEKKVRLSQSALSQHLAVLRNENIVKTRRVAQTIYYSIRDDKILRLLELIKKIYD